VHRLRGRRGARWIVVLTAAITASLHAGPAAASTAWSVPLHAGSHAQAKAENAPAAPTGVTANCQGVLLNGNVVVSWTAVSHAAAYQVYDATSSGGTYSPIGATTTTTTATVAPGILGQFFFKVQAIGGTHWAGALSAAAGPRTITALLICT